MILSSNLVNIIVQFFLSLKVNSLLGKCLFKLSLIVLSILLFLVIVVFYSATLVQAANSINFTPPTTYTTLGQPQSMITYDLNGDGKLDLIVPDRQQGHLYVALGNGNGTFASPTSVYTGNTLRGVTAGDFNGDGKIDLAVVDSGTNQLIILIGDGTGNFNLGNTYSTCTDPRSVVAKDFNEDGNRDLAVTCATSNTVDIFLGNGNGSFKLFSTFAAGSSPRFIATADFNKDGIADLVVADDSGNTIGVFMGKGDGSFGSGTYYTVNADPIYLAVGDFNGDGNIDVFVSLSSSSQVVILKGDGDGTFQVGSPISLTTNFNPVGIKMADFDHDGNQDLVVTSSSFSQIAILRGDGAGGVQTPLYFAASMGVSVVAADFNGDGLPDIALTDFSNGKIDVLLNQTNPFHVAFSSTPAFAQQGVPFTFTTTIEDIYDNPVTTYTGTLHFSSSDGQATLPTDYTFGGGDAGTHTFTATLATNGAQSLTATDTIDSSLFGSANITVASQIVGTGGIGSCNEAAFKAALAVGGYIAFNCGPNPITIPFLSGTQAIVTQTNTIVDGGNLITLSGNNSTRVFSVTTGTNFTLNNLTIANGNASNGGGGIYNTGTLTVTNVTFANNLASSSSGGAVYNNSGGIISSISSSIFVSNTTSNSSGGGAIYNNYMINSISHTTFISNTGLFAYGGTIYNGSGGTISSISNSTFANNSAPNGGGGAIENEGTLSSLINSTFTNNSAYGGGAIENDGMLSSLINSTFANNSASEGGGIYNYEGTINSLINSTFANNSAYGGGAIVNAGTLTFRNSIFAHGAKGGNCYKEGGTFTDGGYNLSDDNNCISASTSISNVTTLNLGTLQNNGGASQTILPGQNSEAIDAIPDGTNGCGTTITTDQRGVNRPKGNGCDVGAVEDQFSSEYLSKFSGDGQSAQEQTLYTSPLVVTVTDTSSGLAVPVSGVQVVFAAPYITDNTAPTIVFSNSNSTIFTATTDVSGTATSDFFYANSMTGTVAVTVTVSYPTLNPHVARPRDISNPATTFTLNNIANPNAITKLNVSASSLSFVAGNSSTAQSLQLKADRLTNWTSSVSYTGDATNWLSLDKTSGSVTPLSAQNVDVSINSVAIKDLADGTYNAVVTFADTSNSNNKTSVNVSLKIGYGAAYSYLLPYLANNAVVGGNTFLTRASIQNAGATPAQISINYYNPQGGLITTAGLNNDLAAATSYQPSQALGDGQSGSALVSSNQPLNIVVVENTNINGKATTSSYTAINVHKDAAANIYAPIALNKAYGDFTTSFVLQNLGCSSTNATVTYYNDNSTVAATQQVSLPNKQQVTVAQSAANLPSNFSGWASVSSTNSEPIAGLVEESSVRNGFLETVNMTASSGKNLSIPTVFQSAFGNFNTGMQLVNPNGTAANVSVTYYRKDGTKVATSSEHSSFIIAANSDKAFYHGSGFPELTTNGGFVGTAVVSSDQPLIAITNQAGSLSGVAFNGTFGTISSGAASVNVPVVVKNSNGYTTGMQVTNVSDIASTATIAYYDQSGKVVYVGKLTSDNGGAIAANGSANPYLGAENHLSDGFVGSAVITADSAGASFVVIANNANTQAFYTYANNK